MGAIAAWGAVAGLPTAPRIVVAPAHRSGVDPAGGRAPYQRRAAGFDCVRDWARSESRPPLPLANTRGFLEQAMESNGRPVVPPARFRSFARKEHDPGAFQPFCVERGDACLPDRFRCPGQVDAHVRAVLSRAAGPSADRAPASGWSMASRGRKAMDGDVTRRSPAPATRCVRRRILTTRMRNRARRLFE